jgi:hypothetical protein
MERDGGEQIPVLGDRHGGHAESRHAIEQLANPAGAVEQRVFGVEVEMDELAHYSHSMVAGGFELMS